MTQIKLRRDTAANFTSKNPVLGIGEPAYETDTKKLKIGDGSTAYTELAYFSSGGGGSAPTNMVTTDTVQTITENKTFDKITIPSSLGTKGIFCEGKTFPSMYQYEGYLYIGTASIKTAELTVVDSTLNGSIIIGDYPEYGDASQDIRFTSTKRTGGTIHITGLRLDGSNTLHVGDSEYPLVIQGSSITDNNNAEFVRLVESYGDGASGYRVYSDGYCEQWDDNTGVSVESITFLKPYKDTNYTVLVNTGYPDDLPVYNSFLAHKKTTTGFSVNWKVTARTNMWRAFGYVQI